ncbi:hypothetical protein ACF0H5_010595 [Mactra antiquata]
MSSAPRKGKVYRPGVKLPPIRESSNSSSIETGNSNPFKNGAKRSMGMSKFHSKANSKKGVIDLSKSEKIMKHVENKRRESLANIPAETARKISFGSIGAKITALIKAKNAFANYARTPKIKSQDDDENNEKELNIEKLPRKPRFASTLSDEAQYAMMKGYEDKVYGHLCRQFPEYRPMLRRNRTPLSGCVVVCSSRNKINLRTKLVTRPRPLTASSCESNDDHDTTAVLSDDEKVTETVDEPAATSTPLPGGDDSSTCSSMPATPIPPPAIRTKPVQVLRDERRMAYALAKEKQLIMTHRYQRAMDILDVILKEQGLNSLSPRIQETDLCIRPLKDFNAWSYAWNHEFEPRKCRTTLE